MVSQPTHGVKGFTFAASLFGTLLGEIQQVFATLNKKNKELEEYMEGYQNFFWDYKYCSRKCLGASPALNMLTRGRVTNYVKNRVRHWVKFQYSYDEAENRVLLLCVLPKNLR